MLKGKNVRGFTLLELLVALTITSVLTAVAIPEYRSYKRQAADGAAMVDLRNGAIAQESQYLDTESYLSCADAQCLKLPGVQKITKNVRLSFAASTDEFTGSSSHSRGTGKIFRWDSSRGGLQ